MNKDFWMDKGASGYTDGEMGYDNSSRLQQKRPQHWLLDPTEPELIPSKKLAVETSNNRSFAELPNVNLPWAPSTCHLVPSQVNDRLFGSESPRTINFGARDFHSVNAGPLDIGKRGIADPFGNDASIALSMSRTMDEPGPCLSYGGIRKVKVSEVKDPDLTFDVGLPYSRGESPLGGDQHAISFGGFQEDPRLSTLSNRLNHVTDSEIGMSIQMGNAFNRCNGNNMSFSGFQQQPGSRPNEFKHSGDGMTIPTFTRGASSTISFNAFQEEPRTNPFSAQGNQIRDSDNVMSLMGTTFNKVDNNTISFGGFPVEPEINSPTGRFSNYDSLLGQSPVQQLETSKEKGVVESNSSLVAAATPSAMATNEAPKNKTETKVAKKLPPNNFPSNVRSLLSTGIMDGVPVKYVSWSREKELAGTIKGSGYLCGCQSCQYSKVLNAYEFERHAGCKTKHPNNHIFFENGKTIYGIVQELRSTHQNMLFEAIQTITGSPINEKAFRIWKASFEAATRELQRIYGKDEINLSCPKVEL